MTLEQAGAVVLIALFAVFIVWGRTKSGQEAVRRVFGSRRDPNPPVKGGSRTAPTSKRTAGKGKDKGGSRSARASKSGRSR